MKALSILLCLGFVIAASVPSINANNIGIYGDVEYQDGGYPDTAGVVGVNLTERELLNGSYRVHPLLFGEYYTGINPYQSYWHGDSGVNFCWDDTLWGEVYYTFPVCGDLMPCFLFDRHIIINNEYDYFVNENIEFTYQVDTTGLSGSIVYDIWTVVPLPSDFSFDTLSGVFTWTPTYNDYGHPVDGFHKIIFYANDGSNSIEDTITLKVNNVNRLPSINSLNDTSVAENQTVYYDVDGSDPDSTDALTYGMAQPPPGSYNLNSETGEFEWTPTYFDSGTYTLIFTVSDPFDTVADTVVVTVINVYCPYDSDGDGLGDPGYAENDCATDNCPDISNPAQSNSDTDSLGDACDNCVLAENDDQVNSDSDSYGDACDNCPLTDNEDQLNSDADSLGDACDNCVLAENDDQVDSDSDSYGDACDNCPLTDNEDQLNSDADSLGDLCDNCPTIENDNQVDSDSDGIGDVCDSCPFDPDNDIDQDGVCGDVDNCPEISNPEQANSDSDNYGDACDNCPDDPDNDIDQDGVCGDVDNCPDISNPAQSNSDADSLGDACDNCVLAENDDQVNSDSDSYGDACDNCPLIDNEDQSDIDLDSIGDICDPCPDDLNNNCCNPIGMNDSPEVISPSIDSVQPSPEEYIYVIEATDVDCDGSNLINYFRNYPSWCFAGSDTLRGHVECNYADTTFMAISFDGNIADTQVVSLIIDKSNQAPQITDTVSHITVEYGSEFVYYPTFYDLDDTSNAIYYPIYPDWCTVQNDSVIGIAPDYVSTQSLMVVVEDFCKADFHTISILTAVCGDANSDGSSDVSDAVYIINFAFAGGPPPEPIEAGDVNCDGSVDVSDAVYIINYAFAGGTEPCDPSGDGLPDC